MIDLAQWRRNAACRRDRALQYARTLKRQLEDARGVDVSLLTSRLGRAVAAARTAHREWRSLNRSLWQQDELRRMDACRQHDEQKKGFDPRECESPAEHDQRSGAWDSLQV